MRDRENRKAPPGGGRPGGASIRLPRASAPNAAQVTVAFTCVCRRMRSLLDHAEQSEPDILLG